MKHHKLGLTSLILASSISMNTQADLTVDLEYRTPAITNGSDSFRTFYLDENRNIVRKGITTESFSTQSSPITNLKNIEGVDEIIQAFSTLYSADQESLELLFENYPSAPTSPEAEAVLAEMSFDVPASQEQFNRIVQLFFHSTNSILTEPSEVTELPIRDTTGGEFVGASATSYYFTQSNGVNTDADLYKCDKALYDFIDTPISQENNGNCQIILSGITHQGLQGSLQVTNYHDLVAVYDNGGSEPHQVILPNGTNVSINSVNYEQLVEDSNVFFYSVNRNLGTTPIVYDAHAGLFDLIELLMNYDPEYASNFPIDLEDQYMFFGLNDGFYYIHDDGFVEQLTYDSNDSYIREMNDEYLLLTRINENQQVSREICSYTITLNYDGANAAGQEDLGGSITCDNIVKTYSANQKVILGYDPEVVAVAIYPTTVTVDGGSSTALPSIAAYVENIITGESISLAGLEREFLQNQGLGQYYDATTLRQHFLDAYEVSITEGDVTSGLMDNYPMPPNSPESFALDPNISQEDFVALIEASENTLMEYYSAIDLLENSSSLYTGEITSKFGEGNNPIGAFVLAYSRNAFKFISPTELMSAVGYYTFNNANSGEITGSVTLPNAEVPEAGIKVTLYSELGTEILFTDAQGSFTFPSLSAGTYQLTFESESHVYDCLSTELLASEIINLSTIELFAGDFNNDGIINAPDWWMFRDRADHPTVDFDMNNDGVVNFLDKEMLLENRFKRQCDL